METRLSEKTLKMAQEALLGKWGKMLKPTTLRLTKEEFEQDPSKMYAACVRHIAEEGDIRINPDELVIGATTLKDCTCHVTPVFIHCILHSARYRERYLPAFSFFLRSARRTPCRTAYSATAVFRARTNDIPKVHSSRGFRNP